jgi:hypothetical protein
MWELAFFVWKQLCNNWCNEGYYSLNMNQDGNKKIYIKESLLILFQLLYIVAKLYTCKSCSSSFSNLPLPSMSSFSSHECNFKTTLWFYGIGQGSLLVPIFDGHVLIHCVFQILFILLNYRWLVEMPNKIIDLITY